MKKLSFVAAMAIAAAATLTSCNGGTPTANLKTDVDTVSYAIGMAQTQGLKSYLAMQLGVDTTYMADFIKGLNDGANAGDNKKQAAYFAGIQIGQQISNQMVKGINYQLFGDDSTKTISLKNFLAGFVTATTGKKGLMTVEEAGETAQRLMQQIKAREMEKTYGPNKLAGEKFLAENAKKEGVKTLPSGVQYRVIKEGTGKIPADTSMVTMHYEGRLINDSVFDSSYKRNQPYTVRCNQNIKGFTEALTHMPAGSTWEIFIPQELAYGERQAGQMVDPFSALIFKVELLDVK
jgi:FKBP-type peptidyl-prolyl cis-trans isomerase FklB